MIDIYIELSIIVIVVSLIGYGCKSFVCTDNNANSITTIEEEIDNIVKDNNAYIEERALALAHSMQMDTQVITNALIPV